MVTKKNNVLLLDRRYTRISCSLTSRQTAQRHNRSWTEPDQRARTIALIACLAVLWLLTGCDNNNATRRVESGRAKPLPEMLRPTTPGSPLVAHVRRTPVLTAATRYEYSLRRKAEFEKQKTKLLQFYRVQMDKLAEEARNSPPTRKERLEALLRKLEPMANDAQTSLTAFKSTPGEGWERAALELNKTLVQMNRMLHEAPVPNH
ncbi:MAG: hypothetical protein M1457_08105 [bacterium]|nr:hypothetical protein [bacterium]